MTTISHADLKGLCEPVTNGSWEAIRPYFISLTAEHAAEIYAIILDFNLSKQVKVSPTKVLANFAVESTKGGIRCKHAKKLDPELQSRIIAYIKKCLLCVGN